MVRYAFLIFLMLSLLVFSCGDDDDDSGGGSGDDDNDDTPPMDDDDDDDDDTTPDDDDDDDDDTTPDDDDDDNDDDDTTLVFPEVPDELRALGVGSTLINLSWTDNSDNENGFKIYRQESGSRGFELIATTGSDVPFYYDDQGECETEYEYYVTAHNGAGESGGSNQSAATTEYCDVAPPSSLSAVVVSDTQIDLFWQDNSFNEDNFQVQRKQEEQTVWTNLGDVEANITSFSDLVAQCGSDYEYRVRAYNQSSFSAWSDMAGATANSCPPVRPRPVLDSVSPNSYVALSREFLEDPPDPLYPLTIHGDGIASDTMAEVNDFMLPCDTGGEGTNCEADDTGDPLNCATSCVVSLPGEIMKNAMTYVVRLNTPDPVFNGLNTSAATRFFNVVAPLPIIYEIWPRGVLQNMNSGTDTPIAQQFEVTVRGDKIMDNAQVSLGGNYGQVLSIETDESSGVQTLTTLVSTEGLFPRDDPYEFGVDNPSPGGGLRTVDFGVNPMADAWRGAYSTDLRATRATGPGAMVSTYVASSVTTRNTFRTLGWTGQAKWAAAFDADGSLLYRVNRSSSPTVFPFPLDAQWVALQDDHGAGSDVVVFDDSDTFKFIGGDGNLGGAADHVEFPTVSDPTDFKVADFDRDGAPDIAVLNKTGIVAIHMGNGDGTFQGAQLLPTGYESWKIATGDVNGDGFPDIVSTFQEFDPLLGAGVNVRISNGDGTFADPVFYTNGGGFDHSIQLGDVNGDGYPDIISEVFDKRIFVRYNDGEGGFGGSNYQSFYAHFGLTNLREITVGDVNGDGLLDVAGTVIYAAAVLLNTGEGRLDNWTRYPDVDYSEDIALTDVNGDGALDMLIASQGEFGVWDGYVGVFLGDGAGNFDERVDYLTGKMTYGLEVIDINSDGLPDIITCNAVGDSVSVLLGNGDGTFQARVEYVMGDAPRALAVADIDLDGAPEIMTLNEVGKNISIRQVGGVTATGQTGYVGYTMGSGSHESVFADLNGDGHADLITPNSASDNFSVRFNDGQGGFGGEADHDDYPMGDFVNMMAAADFNGDDNIDVVSVNRNSRTISTRFGGDEGIFGEKTDYTIPHSGTYDGAWLVGAGRFNNDDFADIAVLDDNYDSTLTICLNNGAGGFGTPEDYQTYVMGDVPVAIAVGDFNNDGYDDVINVNYEGSLGVTLRLAASDGSGLFGDRIVVHGSYATDIAAADFDGDGNLDIVTAQDGDDIITIRFGAGDGTFPTAKAYGMGTAMVVATGDLNEDGHVDLISASPWVDDFRHIVKFRLNKGDGTFGGGLDYYSIAMAPSASVDVEHISAGLLIGDGAAGIAASGSFSGVRIAPLGAPIQLRQELTDSFSDDSAQPWLPKYATGMTNTEIRIHQAKQTISKVGATVFLEWTEQPTGSVTLTMHAPDEEADPIELGTFSEFTAWPDDENPTSWRLNKVFRAYDFQGEDGITEFDDWLGLQPTGYWRLEIDNQTGADAEVKNWTVLTDGHF